MTKKQNKPSIGQVVELNDSASMQALVTGVEVNLEEKAEEIKEILPDFKLKSFEVVQAMDEDDLREYIEELEGHQSSMQQMVMTYQAQIEAKEGQLEEVRADMKEKLGVSTVEELEELKTKNLEDLKSLYEALKPFVEEE